MEFEALKGIDLRIEEGSFTALIGRTGCGKSTLIQHINALLYPSSGLVTIDEFKNSSNRKERSKKVKDLRRSVGLVFQFPEYQLFEETVLKDVCFGPKNFGMKKEEAENGWEEYVRLEYVYDFVEPGIRKRIKEIFRGYANDEPEYHYFAYDSYGRVISWLPEDDDRSLLGDECEYDDYGNLTVVKEYVGTSSHVFVREYEYTPFVIPIEMMTDADKERIPNHGKP